MSGYKRKQVTGKAIAQNYWDKLNKDGTYNTPVNPRHVWIDFGEPRCMGCGFYKNSQHVDVRPNEDTKEKWLNCWNRATAGQYAFLQKCHIIPHCFEGDDSLDNFILLCDNCHKNNPNTRSTKMYQKWLDGIQEWTRWGGVKNEIKEAQERYGVTDDDVEWIMQKEVHGQFLKFYGENVSLVVGEGLNWNTRMAAIAMFVEEHRTAA